MAVADGASPPLASYATSARPHKVTLVHDTLKERFLFKKLVRLMPRASLRDWRASLRQ